MHMIIEFDKLYAELVCENVPKRQLKLIEDMYSGNNISNIDPWDGEKPYAEDGFVVKYCM